MFEAASTIKKTLITNRKTMKFATKILLSLLLSCAAMYTRAQTFEPNTHTLLQIDFPRKHFSLAASFTNQVYNDKSYVEAACSSGDEEFTAKNCSVTLITFDDASVTRNQTCQTGFRADRGLLKSLFVHQERNDTVVLPYLHVLARDQVKFKFRMLRMSTCQHNDVVLPVDPRILSEPIILPQILMYDDGSFELFVPNNGTCIGARCKLSYDVEGERIGENVGYLSPNLADHAVFFAHGPTPNAYYAFVGVRLEELDDDDNSRLFYVDETRSTGLIAFDFNYRQFIDDSHGHFGFCFSSSNDTKVFVINCTQYERDERIVDVEFELRDSLPIATYNVPGGGILLVSSKCGMLYCENLVFREIMLDGSVLLRYVDEFEYLKPSLTDVSDGEDDQLCLTLYSSLSALHLTKKCYPRNLLLRAG